MIVPPDAPKEGVPSRSIVSLIMCTGGAYRGVRQPTHVRASAVERSVS
jgi:hypothetical protein